MTIDRREMLPEEREPSDPNVERKALATRVQELLDNPSVGTFRATEKILDSGDPQDAKW